MEKVFRFAFFLHVYSLNNQFEYVFEKERLVPQLKNKPPKNEWYPWGKNTVTVHEEKRKISYESQKSKVVMAGRGDGGGVS